jgi:hypothetical protein
MAENKDSTSEDQPSGEETESKTAGKDDQSSKPETSERARDEDDDDDDDDDDDEDDDDDDEDDEDDDEDEAKDDKAKAKSAKSAKDDDDDEDDDDEDDDEEEEAPRKKSAPRKPAPAALESEDESEDWLPDWAPWAVLILLLTVGVLGGLGVFNSRSEDKLTAADVPALPQPAENQPAQPAAQPKGDQETIEASHLLVMHKDSMRPAPGVTRTKEEAKRRAEEALAKLRGGANFDQVVAEYTDEPGGKDRKGSLGRFARRAMVKPFSDAAFALRPGQLSGVVETQFGYHVIKRTQ